MRTKMRTKKSGFTLVEILIVVVILGILAAIVIPQFTDAASQANESALASNLQAVRGQIELYKIQHNDNLPTLTITEAMTNKTYADGTIGDGNGSYDRYMREIPVNPFNNLNDVVEAATTPAAATNGTGWFFNTTDGDILANDLINGEHHWGQ